MTDTNRHLRLLLPVWSVGAEPLSPPSVRQQHDRNLLEIKKSRILHFLFSLQILPVIQHRSKQIERILIYAEDAFTFFWQVFL